MNEFNNYTSEVDADILLRYVAESVSLNEKQQVETWAKENETNEQLLMNIARLYYAQQRLERIQLRDVNAAYRKLERRMTRKKRHALVRRIGAAAAVLLLLVGSYGIVQYLIRSTPDTTTITLRSNPEKRVEYLLPDGTVVYLNANSSLIFPVEYSSGERRVVLSGEACFNVAHNPDIPFIVSTGDNRVDIKVSGTVFNLQAYPNDSVIQTTLMEGNIDMLIRKENGESENLSVKPLEQISFNTHSQHVHKDRIGYSGNIAWMDNRLVFKDTPIPEVIRQLSHYYQVEFRIEEEELHNYVFTGTFEDKNLLHVLEYIRISSKINYEKQKRGLSEDVIVLTGKR